MLSRMTRRFYVCYDPTCRKQDGAKIWSYSKLQLFIDLSCDIPLSICVLFSARDSVFFSSNVKLLKNIIVE